MIEKRDYFVYDEFAVIWNDEPLPTFNQACQFRGMIARDLFPRTLSIMSVSRDLYEKPRAIERKTVMANHRQNDSWGKDLDF